jgi:hypothetical protein
VNKSDPVVTTTIPFEDSTPLLSDPQALRERADADGFLFFKNFLPKEPLLELRRQILEVCDTYGWVRKDHPLMDAVADLPAIAESDAKDRTMYAIGVTATAYRDIQSLELFHTIPHHPKLIGLYEKIFGGEVFPHPRHIARVLLPSPSFSPTPPHQDYIYIQGAHSFWTCWFPLGDCPTELGGLAVLKGSHKEPVLDVTHARGAGGFESVLCNKDYAWAYGPYECGDVITFPSHMVHRGMPNLLGDRIRLSCDLRYQPAADPIEEKSLRPHCDVATWEELYQKWTNPSLKYYWREKQLTMSPWDTSLLTAKEKIC